MSTEIIHSAETTDPLGDSKFRGERDTGKEGFGQHRLFLTTPNNSVPTTDSMPPHPDRGSRKRADTMSAASHTPSERSVGACDCQCNCAGCFCSGKSGRDNSGVDIEFDLILLGTGSSEHAFSQGEEGEDYPPAFPWRDPGFGEHVDNRFGGFDMTKDGFQHSESDECEPLQRSMILKDLATFNRTATSTSLANEATSGVASVASSGFLPRRAEVAQNLLDFVGSWDETSPGPGYHFTGQPLWLSPSAWSARHDSGYPAGIREEDMK